MAGDKDKTPVVQAQNTCKHCWHLQREVRSTFSGVDSEVCCRCGLWRHRKWVLAKDPKHGPFAAATIKKYVKE